MSFVLSLADCSPFLLGDGSPCLLGDGSPFFLDDSPCLPGDCSSRLLADVPRVTVVFALPITLASEFGLTKEPLNKTPP